MKAMAIQLGSTFSKIENWFKHHRRALSKRGHFVLKVQCKSSLTLRLIHSILLYLLGEKILQKT